MAKEGSWQDENPLHSYPAHPQDQRLLSVRSPDGSVPESNSIPQSQRLIGTWGLCAMMFLEVGGGLGIDETIRFAGTFWALVSILAASILISVPIALVTAELATMLPQNGGQIHWTQQAMGTPWGFVMGVTCYFASVVDVASLSVLVVDYLTAQSSFDQYQADYLSTPWLRTAVGLGVLTIVAGINMRSTECITSVSIAIMLAAIVPLAVIVALGFPQVDAQFWLRPRPIFGNESFQTGRFLAVLLWNLSGYDMAAACAGEVENPSKVFPQSLAGVVVLNTACYVLPLAVATCTAVGVDEQRWSDGYLITTIAPALGGPLFGLIARGCAAISALGMATTAVAVAARELEYMANMDAGFPKVVTYHHPKWQTPVAAILVTCVVSAIIVCLPFDELVEMSNFAACIAYLIEFASFLKLRKDQPQADRPFTAPGGSIGAACMLIVPTILMVVAMMSATRQTVVWFLLYLTVTLLCYYCHKHNDTNRQFELHNWIDQHNEIAKDVIPSPQTDDFGDDKLQTDDDFEYYLH
jgi:amino acid transporter